MKETQVRRKVSESKKENKKGKLVHLRCSEQLVARAIGVQHAPFEIRLGKLLQGIQSWAASGNCETGDEAPAIQCRREDAEKPP